MSAASGIVGEFLDLKADTEADILAMQCGDFFEFFADDAELVAKELELNLSTKSSGGTGYPMAGVPVDDLTPYLRSLVERGYRVAVAEQYETPDGHSREITRIATPGTLIETSADAAFLAAIVQPRTDVYGLALADVTTGRCQVTGLTGETADDRLITECYRFGPVEILPGPTIRENQGLIDRLRERTDAMITPHDTEAFAPKRAQSRVTAQFGKESLTSLGLSSDDTGIVSALGGLLDYVEASGVGVLPAMTRLRPYDTTDHVDLDVTTQRNLELIEPMLGEGITLQGVLDHTVSAAGRRELRERITRPIQHHNRLQSRLDTVDALVEATMARERLREHLDAVADLERLASQITRGSADARALQQVRESLATIPIISEVIEEDHALRDSPLVAAASELPSNQLSQIVTELDEALDDDPPRTVTEGGVICRGYNDELDQIVSDLESALSWVESLAERERAAHGITHLQVDRNRTDGYYLQVGKSETGAVPEEYREIKTLKNSKRYTTEALEEREREIIRLEEIRFEREYELFCELRDRVAERTDCIQVAGRFLARIDTGASLATHAVDNGWVRPDLLPAGESIEITEGRHPVVEQTTNFVPNDVALTPEERLLLVTGPNMSGKSTYLRQTALIVLLAQIGSFVPASQARIGLVDGIYTRVGALDELSQGRSTFMVEMAELANILHAATESSLVILDEVGRGTATYDGMSIAWAATEYLHNEVGANALFATHYHELTELTEKLPRAGNRHVTVDERDGEVTFLRTVSPGAADRSYGIYVAELAGVPVPVRDRAREVLARLRADRSIEARSGEPVQAVFSLTDGNMDRHESDEAESSTVRDEVLAELGELSVYEQTPLAVLEQVTDWQERLEDA